MCKHKFVTTLSNVETYDPANSSWSENSSLVYERYASAATVYNDKLYVAGGAKHSGYNLITLRGSDGGICKCFREMKQAAEEVSGEW